MEAVLDRVPEQQVNALLAKLQARRLVVRSGDVVRALAAPPPLAPYRELSILTV
jgi:hypothetical protein